MLSESSKALKDLYSLKSQLERINLQCNNSDMTYSLNFDSNFEDRQAFNSNIGRFIEETTILNSIQKIIEQGMRVHAPMLYSWRSLSQTFPTINDDDPNKENAYKAILKVLSDQTESIFEFYKFIKTNARNTFSQEFRRLSDMMSKGESVSEGLLFSLGKLISMFFILDHLTNVKTSLKNDFSAFKRYTQLVGDSDRVSNTSILIQEITMFLANKNQVMEQLKKDIKTIGNFQELLFDIYNYFCTIIEEKAFILPQNIYESIGTICAIIYLLNSDNKSVAKLDNRKKFSLSRADKIFREHPLINFLGDLQFNIVIFLVKLNLSDSSIFTVSEVVNNAKTYDSKFSLVATQLRLRDSHFLVMNQLTQMKTRLLISGGGNVQDANCNLSLNPTWDPNESLEWFNVIRKAFLHLSELSTSLNSAICWKMTNTPTIEKNADGSYKIVRVNDFERVLLDMDDTINVDTYELLTKYNYNTAEKSSLVLLITYMKSLYNILKEMETVAMQIIAARIYSTVQDLIQNKLSDLFIKTTKSQKLGTLKVILTTLRDLCGDQNIIQSQDTSTLALKKKATSSNFDKIIFPLSTQLYMFYTLLSIMINNKDIRKEVDSTSTGVITELLNTKFIYLDLINFDGTLQKCTDLSYLWFREFFLEMSTTNKVQYPIDCSIPWILLNHIIESADPSQTPNLLYLLDIYNDSAEFALKQLKRRYMYDELEAEVNLIFEQLVYNLAEKIYAYYRSYASTIYLNKGYRSNISKMLRQYDKLNIPEAQISMQSVHRYWIFFRQRTIQILGRDVDLAHLLSQRLILSIRKSLSSAMLVFESASITNVFDFDTLVHITRITHKLLSDELPNLPSFDIMFDEANNSVNGKSMSRVTLHILWDLINDFIPNFAFCSLSNKFVRGSVRYGPNVTRPNPPQMASSAHFYGNKSLSLMITSFNQPSRSFVGQSHWILLIKYIGYHGIAVIIEQITRYVSVLLNEKLAPYVDVLRQGMPSKVSLPRFTYGFIGNIKYYSANFDNIFKYKDLYPGVFQTMREIGNCLIIIYCFENALKHFESYQVTYTGPYIGAVPIDSDDSTNIFFKDFMNGYKEQQSDSIKHILSKIHILSSEKLSFGLSIFNYLLYNMKSVLTSQTWIPPIPPNAAIAIDNCVEFHRIFSVLCIAMTQTLSPNNSTPEQIFGDGILWCGVTICTMLGMSQRGEGLDFINHAIDVAENEGIRELLGLFSLATSKAQSKVKNVDDNLQDVLPRMKSISNRRRKIECIIYTFYNSPYFDSVEKIRCFGVPKFTPP